MDFPLSIAAVAPSLLLLGFYYWRLGFSTNRRLFLLFLLFFISGIISGLLALGLQLIFESFAGQIPAWQRFTRTLLGASIRQLFAIAPIEEGCKLAVASIPVYYLETRHSLSSRTIFLCAIAVCLGFSAQENVVYVFHDSESLFDRIIGTPFHLLFSTPWIFVLSKYCFLKNITVNSLRQNYRKYLGVAGLNSIICHVLVNLLSTAGEYIRNLQFLSYGLFPFLLWMFWRFEQYLNLLQNKPKISLISGLTRQHSYWQRGLVVFILMLGGNAIFGMFVLVKIVMPLLSKNIFDAEIIWFILSRTAVNLIFGILAVGIYCYLRNLAKKTQP
ncbi:MAG: PrsW family intramembrane metalloprotease [Methylacidiphilales bacterium]|nr:PrsW family intramembrane metalloprotease [Candidatus Methylacidiphilales bacterium]NJR16002.1 PrsW family intramembrane metalloprotease [Calothrix sp. CSU_2_0]